MTLFLFFSFVCFVLSTAYVLIINTYLLNWRQLPIWNIPQNYLPQTKISVIIPVRNEEENIENCLKSILEQNYPKELFEIIVVNDHSTDNTVSIIESFGSTQIEIIHLCDFNLDTSFNSFKKFGIEKAIDKATGELMMHTDGDCILQRNWLLYFASYFENNRKSFIAGPVNFHSGKNGIQNFQELDFMGMMLITGAAITRKKGYLCNGANLAYTKSLFQAVGGFENINTLASGDDMLLMHKVADYDWSQIGFIKNPKATVYTQPAQTWSDFKQQRIRWASKSSSYSDKSVLLTLILIFLFHCFLVISLLSVFIFGMNALKIFILMVFLKMISDYKLLKNASNFFNNKEAMWQFVPSFFIHIYYIVYIGILSNLKTNYIWKGRQVR